MTFEAGPVMAFEQVGVYEKSKTSPYAAALNRIAFLLAISNTTKIKYKHQLNSISASTGRQKR